MSQRLDITKWLWCLLAVHAGSVWGVARPVSVQTPPSNPSTIEAQAKFFHLQSTRDHSACNSAEISGAQNNEQSRKKSLQLSPYKIEFGHVCEDPNTWEQRYEKKDFKNHRDMGKVRWGDKKGGYGEHYWDLNHAGNAGNIGNSGEDDYRENSKSRYQEPGNNPSTYYYDDPASYDDYDPENENDQERERAKRAYPKVERGRKSERKHEKSFEQESEEEPKPKKQSRKNKEEQEPAEISQEEERENEEEEESYEEPKPRRRQYRKKEDDPKPKEKNQVVLVVSHKDDPEEQQNQYVKPNQPEQTQYQNKPALTQYLPQNQGQLPQYQPQQQAQLPQYLFPKQHLEPPHLVPYEGGAGVRQHQQPEVSAATTAVTRLFLEPSTGHVVDRATGQAYVLQPIASQSNYN